MTSSIDETITGTAHLRRRRQTIAKRHQRLHHLPLPITTHLSLSHQQCRPDETLGLELCHFCRRPSLAIGPPHVSSTTIGDAGHRVTAATSGSSLLLCVST